MKGAKYRYGIIIWPVLVKYILSRWYGMKSAYYLDTALHEKEIYSVILFSRYNIWYGMSTLFPLTKGNGAFWATPEQALRCTSALLPYIKLCFLRSKSELDQRPKCQCESTSICLHHLESGSPGQNMITSQNIKIASGTQVLDLRS